MESIWDITSYQKVTYQFVAYYSVNMLDSQENDPLVDPHVVMNDGQQVRGNPNFEWPK